MGNTEESVENTEILEEIKIENAVETEEESKFEQWLKEVGEKTLADVIRLAAKGFQYLGKLKLKYIAYALGGILALILSWLLIRYVIWTILYGISGIILYDFAMTTGIHENADNYKFFDSDLWCTIPLCLVVSITVAHYANFIKDITSFLFGLFYFAILVVTLEFWDYSFIETTHTNTIHGGICFFLFFVIIPSLFILKFNVYSRKNRSIKDKEDDDIVPKNANS